MSLENLKAGDKFRIGSLEFHVTQISNMVHTICSTSVGFWAHCFWMDQLVAMGAQIITVANQVTYLDPTPALGCGGSGGSGASPAPTSNHFQDMIEACIQRGYIGGSDTIPQSSAPLPIIYGNPNAHKCECGSASVGVSKHSDWCPMHGAE